MVHLIAYERQAWDGFLISKADPFCRLRASQQHRFSDIAPYLPAECAFFLFHINRSKSANFPIERTNMICKIERLGICVLNGRLVDITKRKMYEICHGLDIRCAEASRQGPAEELLIIKSNENHGGKYAQDANEPSQDLCRALASYARRVRQRKYPILQRRAIPEQVWSDRQYVIEKYICNSRAVFFRAYKFLANIVVFEGISKARIKDMNRRNRRRSYRLSGGFYNDLVCFSNSIGLDYGAIDVMVDEWGTKFIVDVNATPFVGDWGFDPLMNELIESIRSSFSSRLGQA